MLRQTMIVLATATALTAGLTVHAFARGGGGHGGGGALDVLTLLALAGCALGAAAVQRAQPSQPSPAHMESLQAIVK